MSFLVIIPSKDIGNLVPCVEAVRQHEPDARIIVVDDGLKLNTPMADSDQHFWLCDELRIVGKKPFVYAANVNLGIQTALEDPSVSGVVALNDDALLETPGGLSLLARAAADNPDVGIIGATTNVTGWPEQLRRIALASGTQRHSDNCECGTCGPGKRTVVWGQHDLSAGLRVVRQFAFVCVYIPRRTIERVGLLDERYCLDYGVEDTDYCEAVRCAGLKCAVHDGCYVDHGSLRSTYRGDPKAPGDYSKNHELFKQKWGVDIWGARV